MSVDIWDYNEVNRVKSLIDEYFYVAIARAVNNKRAGVHVTDLVSECERKRFYLKTATPTSDITGHIYMWIGSLLHTTPLTSYHETTYEYNGVIATIDEYDDKNQILFDKKFVRNIPVNPPEEYVNQLRYYYAIMHHNGVQVKGCGLYYMNYMTLESKFVPVHITQSVPDILREIDERKESLLRHIDKMNTPDRNVGERCKRCYFSSRCFQ